MALKLVLLQWIFGILFGTSAGLWRAAFLLVSESIDSPRWTTRWWYRYCDFSLWFSITLPLFIAAFGSLEKNFTSLRIHPSIWLISSALSALGLYFLHRRFSLHFEPKKVAGRKALATKWKARPGR
jgi:hypothetical protein